MAVYLKGAVTEDGATVFVGAVETELFDLRKEIARDLHKQGQFTYGVLSRAVGENMSAYISRRLRWWDRVQQLDNGIQIPDAMRAEYMLDSARLTEDQKLHV